MTNVALPRRPPETDEPARQSRSAGANTAPARPHPRRRNAGKPLPARVFDTLSSVKFAVGVVIVIAIACVAGTLIPQGLDAAKYVESDPGAAARMEILGRLGLTNVYSAWWFIGLLGLLSATVAVCSTRRFSTVLRATGFARGRAFGSMLTHISILLILGGGIIRGVWGEKGYLEFHEGQTAAGFTSERGGVTELPFALRLADFTVETYADPTAPASTPADAANSCQLAVHWPEKDVTAEFPVRLNEEQLVGAQGAPAGETFRITTLRYEPDFVIGKDREITSRSAEPRNPAVLVKLAGPGYENQFWLFARYPNMRMESKDGTPDAPPLHISLVGGTAGASATADPAPVKAFRSTIDVVENGTPTLRSTAEVNHPFTYKGWSFYQSGYNPEDPGWTSLQVVRDPGVPVVYAGFLFMILGLFIVFYLNPWLRSREKTS